MGQYDAFWEKVKATHNYDAVPDAFKDEQGRIRVGQYQEAPPPAPPQKGFFAKAANVAGNVVDAVATQITPEVTPDYLAGLQTAVAENEEGSFLNAGKPTEVPGITQIAQGINDSLKSIADDSDWNSSALYANLFYSKQEKMDRVLRIHQLTNVDVADLVNNDDVYNRMSEVLSKLEKLEKLPGALKNENGELDMALVEKAMPYLKKVQQANGTAAAVEVLKNAQTFMSINDVYSNAVTRFFGSAYAGLQRSKTTLERQFITGRAMLGGRRLTLAEEKELAKNDAKMQELPRYSYTGVGSTLGAMVGGAAENTALVFTGPGIAKVASLAVGGGALALTKNPATAARAASIAQNVISTAIMAGEIGASQYEENLGKVDAAGNYVYTPEQARALSMAQGLGEGILEQYSLKQMSKAIFGKSAAPALKDIIKKNTSAEAARAGIKEYAAVKIQEATKAGLISFGAEAGEEFSQQVSDMVLENMAQAMINGKDARLSSIEEILASSTGAMLQALPSLAGFGIIGFAGHPVANTRAVLNMRRVVNNKLLQGRMINDHYNATVDSVRDKLKDVPDLQNKSPEAITTVLDEQNRSAGMEHGFVDVANLSKEEGGQEIVQKVAEAAGVSEEELSVCMNGSGMLQVKTSALMQMQMDDTQRKILNDNTAANLDALTKGQENEAKKTALQMMKDLENLDAKTSKQSIDNIIAARFPDGGQAKLAREILEANYVNPLAEYKSRLNALNADIQEYIGPVLTELQGGMKQGVEIIRNEADGTYLKESNNADWYRNWYADHKRAPNKEELERLAADIASGRQSPQYGLQDYQNNTDESEAYFEPIAERLDQLFEERQQLLDIGDRMRSLNTSEMAATAALSPEALKVYDAVIKMMQGSENKDVQKAGRLNALFMARYAENMAKVFSRIKNKPYTAEDFARERFRLNVNAVDGEMAADAAQFSEAYKQLHEKKPSLEITGREFGQYSDIKQLRKKAIDYYKSELQGSSAKNNLLGAIRIEQGFADNDIYFSRKGLKKFSHTSAQEVKLLAVNYLKDIIEESKVISESDSLKESHTGEHFYFLHSSLTYKGNKYYIVINVLRDKRKDLVYYNHNVYNANEYIKIEDTYFGTNGTGDSSPAQNSQKVSSVTNSITEKQGEIKTLKQNAYHGSPHVFDNESIRIVERLEQSAMSKRNAPKTLGEFDKAVREAENPSKIGFWFTTSKGAEITISGSSYKHVQQGNHPLTLEQWKAILDDFENVEYARKDNVKGVNSGIPVQMKVDTALGKAGISTEFLPNGKVYIDTVVFNNDAAIDNWIKNKKSSQTLGIEPDGYQDRILGSLSLIHIIQNKLGIVKNKPMNQQEKGNIAKGAISYSQNKGEKLISLFSGADQSTFVHEMAHMFLLDLEEIAGIDPSGREAKDLKTIMDWAQYQPGQAAEYKGTESAQEFSVREAAIRAAEKDGNVGEAERLKREWAQERFARGFEEYLRTGESPSRGLQKAFRQFKKWLGKIYQDVTGAGVRATPEVEAIMSRMIASEEEIEALAAANKLARLQKLDPDILETDVEAMHKRWQEEAKAQAKEKLLKVLMRQYKKQNKKDLEKTLESVRETEQARMTKMPCYVCEEMLRTGEKEKVALGITGFANKEEYKAALKEAGGSLNTALKNTIEEVRKSLLTTMPTKEELYRMAEDAFYSGDYSTQLAALESEMLNKRQQQYEAATAAAQKAFDGVSEALKSKDIEKIKQAIRDLKYVQRWTQSEWKRITDIEKGAYNIEKDQEKKDAALEKLQSKYDNLKANTIQNKKWVRNVRDATLQKSAAIKKYVEQHLANQPISVTTNPNFWHRKELQEGRKAWEELGRGQYGSEKANYEAARQAKVNQAMFAAMTAKAVKNRKELGVMLRVMKKHMQLLSSGKTKADADLRYFHNHLLYIFGIRSSDAIAPTEGKTFEDVLKTMKLQHEIEGEVPGWLVGAAESKTPIGSYQELTMDKMEQLYAFSRILYTLSRNQNQLLTTDKDMDEIRFEMAKDFETIYYQTGKQRIGEIKGAMGEYMNSLVKPEMVLSILGGKHGAHIQYIYRTLFMAAENEEKAWEEEAKTERELYERFYPQQELRAILNDPIEITDEKGAKHKLQIGDDEKITKERILCMALNWGNEINRSRLCNGLQMNEEEVFHLIETYLTENDWNFVQAMWDHIGEFADPVSKVLEKSIGLPMTRVKADAFTVTLQNGQMKEIKGGYYPIVKDRNKSSRVNDFEQIEEAHTNAGAMAFATGMGSTKERSESKNIDDPLCLELDVAHNHIRKQIHIIHSRMAARDAYKVLNDPLVRQQIESTFGPKTLEMLNEWALNCWAPPVRPQKWYEECARKLRSASVSAIMAYRVSTALLNGANFVYMIDEIGAKNTMHALADFYKHPQRNRRAILATSIFMKQRASNMDRDLQAQTDVLLRRHGAVGNAIDKATGGRSEDIRYWIDAHANWLIEETDMIFSLPLYHWAFKNTYNAEMAKGVPKDKARETANFEATRMVTKVFPSSRAIDSSAMQRARDEFGKLLTPFFSFANTMMNAVWYKYYEGKYQGVKVPMTDVNGNVMKDAAGNVQYTTVKKSFRQRWGGFILSFIMRFVLGAAVETLIRKTPDLITGGGDDDDEEDGLLKFAKESGRNAIESAAAGFPGINLLIDAGNTFILDGKTYGSGRGVGVLSGTLDRYIRVAKDVGRMVKGSDKIDMLDLMRDMAKLSNARTGMSDTLTDAIFNTARFAGDEYSLDNMDDLREYIGKTLFDRRLKNRGKFLE